jgi:hypothetical protein
LPLWRAPVNDAHGHAGTNWNTGHDAHTYGHTGVNSCSDTGGHFDADANRYCYTDRDTLGYAAVYGFTDTNGHFNTNGHTWADENAKRDSHTHSGIDRRSGRTGTEPKFIWTRYESRASGRRQWISWAPRESRKDGERRRSSSPFSLQKGIRGNICV